LFFLSPEASNYEFLHINFPQVQVYINVNGTDNATSIVYEPVSISSGSNGLTANVDGSNTWTFTSSFPIGTIFNYSFEQNNTIYSNSSYMLTFTNEDGTNLEFNTPPGFTNMENSTVTIHTLLCDEHIIVNTTINITTITNGSSSNSLSAGAIVGIVVAGVVVIGVAAWWLCMRRRNDESKSYKPLEE